MLHLQIFSNLLLKNIFFWGGLRTRADILEEKEWKDWLM